MRTRLGSLIPCVLLVLLNVSELAGNEVKEFEAVDCQRRTIYHSPQTPGYTCWVNAWTMPDGSVMVTFCQATGPLEGRPRAAEKTQKRLSVEITDPRRDMTGLDQQIIYLRSNDGGETWKRLGERPLLHNPVNVAASGTTCLGDGTLLRAFFGGYVYYDDVPETGVVQRSTDTAKTWDRLRSVLAPEKFTFCPVGLRPLRDGRVALLGGVSAMSSDRPSSEWYAVMAPRLLISADSGMTWGHPIHIIPKEYRKDWSCEECDMAELPNGDLFWVFRRAMPEDADKPAFQRRHTYWQGVAEKRGNTWRPKGAGPSPFPNLGLPNLLAMREGAILLVNAGHWTADAGKTWHPVKNIPDRPYYPKAVQLADGRILVFGHIGTDDPYGVVDQSIVMDSFRLKIQ